MLENTERDIIRVLTEFKFGLIDKNEFVVVLDSFYKKKLQYEMNLYANEGWREKIIFSFFMLAYHREEYLTKIENDIFLNSNGKELKSYLLVISLMSTNDTKNDIYDKLINIPNLFSFQKDWIYAACKISKNNKIIYMNDQNIDKCQSKYIEAITIINSIRIINNIEPLKYNLD